MRALLRLSIPTSPLFSLVPAAFGTAADRFYYLIAPTRTQTRVWWSAQAFSSWCASSNTGSTRFGPQTIHPAAAAQTPPTISKKPFMLFPRAFVISLAGDWDLDADTVRGVPCVGAMAQERRIGTWIVSG